MNTELILKYIKGEATDAEKSVVIEWIELDSTNKEEYLTLRRLVELDIWNTDYVEMQSLNSQKKFTNPRINFSSLAYKIVAVFALAFLLINYFKSEEQGLEYQTIVVPTGQRVELLLSDGTSVWLNSNSKFKFPTSFKSKTRHVELEGEAYFDVARDEDHPFIVSVDEYDITVLGTEFDVKFHDNILETFLIDGLVEISSDNTGQVLNLKAGDAIRGVDGMLTYQQMMTTKYFMWKKGLIYFDDENIKDFLLNLSNYFGVKVKIESDFISNKKLTGKFYIRDGIFHILKTLSLDNGFDYTYNESEDCIVISKR